MDEKDILRLYVDMALGLLYVNDKYLICNGAISEEGRDAGHHVGERAIVFRFAHYLQNLINEDSILKYYNLDCEYNRNGAGCKSLPDFPNGVFPDLIIHKRGSNDDNLLVMEFKTYWNNNRMDDKKKIEQLMNPAGKYRYKYGASVLIDLDKPIVEWLE